MIDFEQDTLDFYRLFASLLEDETERQALEQIIGDEEAHIRKLEACRDQNLACHRL
jgi:rubrerythrin